MTHISDERYIILMSNVNDNSKSTGLPKVSTTWRQIDSYLKGMPKKLRYYILNDCIVDWDVKSIYKQYRKIGAEGTIKWLKDIEAEQTVKVYGCHHPQVK